METQKSYNEILVEAMKRTNEDTNQVQETSQETTNNNEVVENGEQSETIQEVDNASEVTKDSKEANSTKKKHTFQERYNKLHSTYMQETEVRKALESRLAQLESKVQAPLAPQAQLQSEPDPEFETADDILSYIKNNAVSKTEMKTILDDYFATAKNQMLKETKEQEFSRLDAKFKEDLLTAFQDKNDPEYGFDESTSKEASLVYERFAKDPEYWSSLVKTNGMKHVVNIVLGKASQTNKVDAAKQILNKADRTKTINNGLSNVSAELNIKSNSSYKDILKATMQALKSK